MYNCPLVENEIQFAAPDGLLSTKIHNHDDEGSFVFWIKKEPEANIIMRQKKVK